MISSKETTTASTSTARTTRRTSKATTTTTTEEPTTTTTCDPYVCAFDFDINNDCTNFSDNGCNDLCRPADGGPGTGKAAESFCDQVNELDDLIRVMNIDCCDATTTTSAPGSTSSGDSDTEIDLSLGDMVVKIKKLKKEPSFNIDSPVGTVGIRGTTVRVKASSQSLEISVIDGLAKTSPISNSSEIHYGIGTEDSGTILKYDQNGLSQDATQLPDSEVNFIKGYESDMVDLAANYSAQDLNNYLQQSNTTTTTNNPDGFDVNGAFILMNSSGTVTYKIGTQTQTAPSNGSIVPVGYTIQTGNDGIVYLLLTNETTITLLPNTEFDIANFRQNYLDETTTTTTTTTTEGPV